MGSPRRLDGDTDAARSGLAPLTAPLRGRIGERLFAAAVGFLRPDLPLRAVPRSGSGREKGDFSIDSAGVHLEVKTVFADGMSPDQAVRMALRRGHRASRRYQGMVPVAVVLARPAGDPVWQAIVCSCGQPRPGAEVFVRLLETRPSMRIRTLICRCIERIDEALGGKGSDGGGKDDGRGSPRGRKTLHKDPGTPVSKGRSPSVRQRRMGRRRL